MAPPSALFGRPPLTDDDYWIVKSLQRSMIARLQASGQLKGPAPPLQPEKGLKLPLPSHVPGEYRGPNYVAAATTSIVLIILVTGLRLAIRARNPKQHWGKDDWAMLLALPLSLVPGIVVLVNVRIGGLGKHLEQITYYEYYNFFWWIAASVISFYLSVSAIKVSIIFFYMRLSGVSSRRWMIAHWTLFTTVILYAIVGFCFVLFSCRPIVATFDMIERGKLDGPPKCVDDAVQLMALNIVHIVTDFLLLVVPIAIIWKVQMKWSLKLRICLVGIIGITSCVAAIMRTWYNFHPGRDPTWEGLRIMGWMFAEITAAMIAASLPILSVLAVRIGNALSKKYRSSHGTPPTPTSKGSSKKPPPHRRRGHPNSVTLPSTFVPDEEDEDFSLKEDGVSHSGTSFTVKGDDDEDIELVAGAKNSRHSSPSSKQEDLCESEHLDIVTDNTVESAPTRRECIEMGCHQPYQGGRSLEELPTRFFSTSRTDRERFLEIWRRSLGSQEV